MYTASLLALAAVAFAAPAKLDGNVGSVSVFNNCPYEVNFWEAIGGTQNGVMYTVSPGGSYSEVFDPASANHKTLTLMTTKGGPFSQDPKTVLGYTWAQDQNVVYYDLYPSGPSAFEGQAVLERSVDGSCGQNY